MRGNLIIVKFVSFILIWLGAIFLIHYYIHSSLLLIFLAIFLFYLLGIIILRKEIGLIAKQSVGEEIEVEIEPILHKEIFKDCPEGVVCAKRDGTIILVNDTFLRMIGEETSKNLNGRKIGEFLQLGVRNSEVASVEKRETSDKEMVSSLIIGDKKREVNIQIIKKRFLQYPEDIYIFFISEIPTSKGLQIEKDHIEAHLSNFYKIEAIGQLAGGIAHEYNNLLGAISGYADLISQRIGNSDEKIKRYSEMILAATTRASELTKNLLIFARKKRMNMIVFDVNKALSEIVDFLNRTLDKKIIIRYDENIKEEVYICGDKIDFQNAIMNIALNSQDAMPEGGTLSFVSEIVEIKDTFTNKNGCLIKSGKYFSVSISDTGCGMSEEVQKHLFEPFFTTKDNGKGKGLGLASVYGTVKSHNGFIEVESILNKGTTVKLFFPIVNKEEMCSTESQKKKKAKSRKEILLVDDENILREAVKDILVRLGYEITACADAREALSIFSKKKDDFELVILDMKMPHMNGLECFREMKKEKADVKVLIATGYLLEEELDSLKKEGVVGILQKPFISSQLEEAIKGAIGE